MNPPLPRRAVLLAGFGVLGGAVIGCDAKAPVEPTTGPEPAPTQPPVFAGGAAAAKVEEQLARQARSLLKAGGDDLGRPLTAILTAAAAGHQLHLAALTAPEPTGRPTSGGSPRPTPKPTKAALPGGLKELAAGETAAAGQYAERAAAAESVTALFWASLAAAADGYGQALRQQGASTKGAGPAKAPKPGPHRPVQAVEPEQARKAMVDQLHAVAYGYQTAIGHLTEDRFERAATALREHRSLRDRLIEELVEASADVPPAAPAYDLPVRPTDPASAAKLIMTLETALLPFCGQWVAAADSAEDRELAVATLRSTSTAAAGWGGPLLSWPGYVEP
ncbi:ferritin-like domain-containing protein [Microlunatus sp. GCM10028923]|uniref:ferritin-like domain-containing protein n=1 Tax=Microlunatus sp. GCM10028923 TaxID=3273400 RepID=UPI00361E7F39